ncbi:bifunctional phosphoribosylaminoimidazolecarboxamide formyltransferase/IMP cyclohydrolase [Candidatus Omnitrophota bacterium]
MKVKRALISVSDKTGLEGLAKTLGKYGVEILSTGGTAKKISDAGVPVKEVSDYTGFPEMMDGRVKTLHPKIHGGLLALRANKDHVEQAKKHDIGMIDMVVVNLYPFEKVTAKESTTFEHAIENIDIGGPSMLRSAAKNFRSVAVVCDPAWYQAVIDELDKSDGCLSEGTCFKLAVEVFKRTAQYDGIIGSYLTRSLKGNPGSKQPAGEVFQDTLDLKYKKVQALRYGENPHQQAAFYRDESIKEPSVSNAVQLHGKELSFNNIIDLNAAVEIVKEFPSPAATVIKHTNPCGTAVADDLSKAYLDALDCDRVSAFGSIVGLNRNVDIKAANTILKEADFVECIIAPSYDEDALAALKVKKNLRALSCAGMTGQSAGRKDADLKKVVGGLLIQDRDTGKIGASDLKAVTKKKPTKDQIASLLFGWLVVKHVKSNAIVLCKGTKTIGVGAGQMSRVDAVSIAVKKAGSGKTKGSVLASDAFFPKADSIDEAKKAGVSCIIQPGGSIRDQEVIDACDDAGIAMVFTGMRHFKH